MMSLFSPFVNLSAVDPREFLALDQKRALSEQVAHPLNMPSHHKGNDVGVLLVHGFGASPFEMLPVAEYLQAEGYTTYVTRTAGHGSQWENMKIMTCEDWYESLKFGYWYLRNTCKKVILVGQSMGGLLSLTIALHNPVDGLVLLAPAFRVKDRRFPLIPHVRKFLNFTIQNNLDESLKYHYYNKRPLEGLHQLHRLQRYVLEHVSEVTVPLLALHSVFDETIDYRGTLKAVSKIGSADASVVILDDQLTAAHVLTDAQMLPVRNAVTKWIRRIIE